MGKKIHCSILTPERLVFEGDVDAAYMVMHDGERGFLPDHAPMVSTLGIGEMRLITGERVNYFEIEGGFVEVSGNRLVVLAEEAMKNEELSEKQIRAELDLLDSQMKAAPDKKGKLDIKRKKMLSRLNVASR
jgi:F-type H+-transporting ATPase subunit epsilon